MINKIKKKLIGFLIVWGFFLLLSISASLLTMFILGPIIIFFRSGEIVFLPDMEYAKQIVKTVALGSFLAALVTWFWAEFFPNMKIK